MTVSIISSESENVFSFFDDELYPIFFSPIYHKFENSNGFETGFVLSTSGIKMPFRIYKKYFFRFMQIMYPPMLNGERLDETQEKDFFEQLLAYLKKTNEFHRIMQPFLWNTFKVAPRGSIFCKLGILVADIENKTSEQILASYKTSHRSDIKKVLALDNVVDVKFGDAEIDTFFNVYLDLHQKQHIAYHELSFFQNMKKLVPQNNMIANVYANNKVEGGACILYSKQEAYYLFGSSVSKYQYAGSIKLLHYTIMQKLSELGVKRYVLGIFRLSNVAGTKAEGIQMFKKHFGAEVKVGYVWRYDVNTYFTKMYDWLIYFQCKLTGQKVPIDFIDHEKNNVLKTETVNSTKNEHE